MTTSMTPCTWRHRHPPQIVLSDDQADMTQVRELIGAAFGGCSCQQQRRTEVAQGPLDALAALIGRAWYLAGIGDLINQKQVYQVHADLMPQLRPLFAACRDEQSRTQLIEVLRFVDANTRLDAVIWATSVMTRYGSEMLAGGQPVPTGNRRP